MMEAQEVEAFPALAREAILVLSGCNRSPSGARIAATRSRACSARGRVWHNTTRSSA